MVPVIVSGICLFPLAGLDQQYSIPVRVQSDDSGSEDGDDDGDDNSDGDDDGDANGDQWADTSSEEGESVPGNDGVGEGWASSSEGEED